MDNCTFCANHVEKKNQFYSISLQTFVLVPEEELEFWQNFMRSKNVTVLGGSMDNVLERYQKLGDFDYVVRLTSDCPNVPALTINKAIFTAIHHCLDYLANSWEKYRTAIDGHDCEIMSAKAMKWLDEAAHSEKHVEHVTLAIRELMPTELKLGTMMGKEDISHIKLCIDTADDYAAASRRFSEASEKRKAATLKGISVYEY